MYVNATVAIVFAMIAPAIHAAEQEGTTIIVFGGLEDAQQINELKRHVGEIVMSAPPSHQFIVVNGPRHETVVNISIPSGAARVRLRNAELAQSLRKLNDLFKPSTASVHGGQVGIPNIAGTYWSLAAGNGSCRIILVGTPLYGDPEMPFWSFRERRFPSDASLFHSLSSNPFINRTFKKMPEDVSVVFLAPVNWGDSQEHRDRVIRFLRLAFQESIGGSLNLVTNSSHAVFSETTSRNRGFEAIVRDSSEMVGMWKLSSRDLIEGSEKSKPVQSNVTQSSSR